MNRTLTTADLAVSADCKTCGGLYRLWQVEMAGALGQTHRGNRGTSCRILAADLISPRLFRRVERLVGPNEERLRRIALPRQRQPHADRDCRLFAAGHAEIGASRLGADAVGDFDRCFDVATRQEHGELVSAETGDEIAFADQLR